jgi:TFIIF-interacting CTD phosphatase-like protein
LRKFYHKDIKECLEVLNPPRSEPNPLYEKRTEHRITLIFDLDETLLKSVSDANRFPNAQYDEKISLNDGKELFISFRPFMVEMLKKLHKHYELILFTAGHRPYADAVVNLLQKTVMGCPAPIIKSGLQTFNKRLFQYVLARDCCTQMPFRKNSEQYYYMKDLRMLFEGRRIQDMLIIDNRALSFASLHLTNGIPIKDYEGDKQDRELYSLTDYLMSIRTRVLSERAHTP